MNDPVIVSTKDRPGDYDAIETAKPGEPLFPIQGGDPRGPATVQFWAEFARACARALLHGSKVRVGPTPFIFHDSPEDYQPTEADERAAEKLLAKATSAEQVSWAMQAYQRGEADEEGERAVYNDGLAEQISAEAADRAAVRKAMIAGVRKLHNAIAEVNDVAEVLVKLGEHPEPYGWLVEATALTRRAAEVIEPRRGRAQT